MALLRGEVASLRKTIWCFGTGTWWGTLVGNGDGLEEIREPSGEYVDMGGGGGGPGNEKRSLDGVEEKRRRNSGVGEERRGDAEVEDKAERARPKLEWADFEMVSQEA